MLKGFPRGRLTLFGSQRKGSEMRRRSIFTLLVIALLLGGATSSFLLPAADQYKDIARSIKLFGEVYRRVALNYVDTLDPQTFVEAGIRGMLSTLDPYTVYLREEEYSNLDILTKGKYGGVGIRLGMQDDTLTVISTLEGTPANRSGIRAGDRIIGIDGESSATTNIEQAAGLIRGKKGTTVTLQILRAGESEPTYYLLTRQDIKVRDVVYAGIVRPGIGFIRLSSFSRQAGREMEEAVRDLSRQDMEALIIDLRNNTGGLLQSALDVLDLIVPEGMPLVSTKGRVENVNRKYNAKKDPILDEEVHLVILVNEGTASASEIVAGVIQDLDAGLILGVPTFGKGLVQTVFDMPGKSRVKVTTAKYYIPSGRFIQKATMADSRVLVEPDSLGPARYLTANGREVYGGGGILPDVTVKPPKPSRLLRELWRQGMFFKFAVHVTTHEGDSTDILQVDDELLRAFRQFVRDRNFSYAPESEEEAIRLEKALRRESFPEDLLEEASRLRQHISNHSMSTYDLKGDEIRTILEREIADKLQGAAGRYGVASKSDPVILAAIDLLEDRLQYRALLGFVTE